MEDLDPPREVAGAASDILRTLEAFGLHWDGPVMYQSGRHEAYAEALAQLLEQGRAFGCACTRKLLAGVTVYPGHCRSGLRAGQTPRSYRHAMASGVYGWRDSVQGSQAFDAGDLGDFVIKRADGHWAYQLAVVVDDVAQGINAVVRGADLLDSTPRQIALRQALAPEAPAVSWSHLPILVNADGQKLSKQTLAAPVEAHKAPAILVACLSLLGQPCAREEAVLHMAKSGDAAGILAAAAQGWEMARVPAAPIHWQG
jgi:glutamyl-Q tRNA(Asp) synthetase